MDPLQPVSPLKSISPLWERDEHEGQDEVILAYSLLPFKTSSIENQTQSVGRKFLTKKHNQVNNHAVVST